MNRKVFLSYYYGPDNPDTYRAYQIRDMKIVETNPLITFVEWRKINEKSNVEQFFHWMRNQLSNYDCTIVLIGKDTWYGNYIDVHIDESWKLGKGVFGLNIGGLEDENGSESSSGPNPIIGHHLYETGEDLSTIVKTYYPPSSDSKSVYDYIRNNLLGWIEDAIQIRSHYPF